MTITSIKPVLIVIAALGTSTFVQATSVTNTNDSGAGSLRQAITDTASNGTITFDPAVAGTITLTSGELVISNKNLTIQGPGPGVLSTSGNNASRVFYITGSTVTLSGLTITGGDASLDPIVGGFGGAIECDLSGNLNVVNCVITGNKAGAANKGGGVDNNNGTLNVTNSTISFNDGGGINNSDNLNVTGCTINNNTTGPGILHGGVVATIRSSTISGNDSGGINNDSTLTVVNSTITGNSLNGGILTASGTIHGTTTIKSTIVAGNSGNPNNSDVFGSFTSLGFNLVGKTDGSTGFTAATDQSGTVTTPLDPGLDPNGLQNNGGPTKTINLVGGSAAVDKGDGHGMATDQRGFTRVFDFNNVANATGGDGSDVGAVELGSTTTPTPSPTPTPTPPTAALSVTPTSVGKTGTATFTISLSASTFQNVTVNYSMSGNAVLGMDYTLSGTSNQVTIPIGQTSAVVTLTVRTMKTKGKEKATMTLGTGMGYQLPTVGKKHKVMAPKVTVTISNK
jgi:hypothetical protein